MVFSMARNTLKLPCALKNGAVVAIERAKSHEKGLVCPGCYQEVVVRRGEKRIPHFAHKAGTTCTTGYQTALHMLAKEIIANEKRFRIPDLSEKYGMDGYHTVLVLGREVLFSHPLVITLNLSEGTVITEQKLFDRIPDILIEYKGQKLIVEIYVTHKVTEDKIADFQKQEISIIEIDLSKQGMLSEEQLRELLCDSTEHKTWLYNRKLEWISNKIDFWEGSNSDDKYVIHTPKKIFSIGTMIDENVIFKLYKKMGKKEPQRLLDCPRKIHYSKNSFHALKEECDACPYFIGYFNSLNPNNSENNTQIGILCQKQYVYQGHTLDDFIRWLQEFSNEEAIRICRSGGIWPYPETWKSIIKGKALSFISELIDPIDSTTVDSIVEAVAFESYRIFL